MRSNAELDSRFTQLQRATQRQVRAFDRPPYRPRPTPLINPLEVDEILPRGVVYRAIYDTSAVRVAGRVEDLLAGIRAGEQARVLPDVPMKLLIFDDRAALVPFARHMDETNLAEWLVVQAPGLLHALIALFEVYWERALPLRLGEQPASSVPTARQPLSARDRQILGLVASGLTDQAIARQLRISRSTVQRHIHGLMESLGARTRFQAGVQASRRGWL